MSKDALGFLKWSLLALLFAAFAFKSEARDIPLDKALFSHTTGAEPASGKCNLYFKNDDILYKYCNGGSELPVGSGVGGGLDSFLSEDYEITTVSDFSSDQNATFLSTGGTFGGTLANETSSPVAGLRSIKYTAGASSTNDWIAGPVVSLDAKQAGQWVGVSFYYKWSGSVDVEFVANCTTGDTAKYTDALDVISTASSPTRFTTAIFVSSSCTALKYGFHFINAPTASDVLIFDDVELSTNPFVYKNLTETQNLKYSEDSSVMQDRTSGEHRFSTSLTSSNITGSGCLSVEDDSGNTRTKFIALSACEAVVSYSGPVSSTSTQLYIYKNGSLITEGSTSGASGNHTSISAPVHLDAGDYITLGSSTALETTGTVYLNISSFTPSEHVITPAKSNMSDWESYTPTTQGLGTLTSSNFKYRRVGDSLEIQGKFNTGTTTASELQIGLPSGLTIDSTKIDVVKIVGTGYRTANSDANYIVIATGGDAYLNMSLMATGTPSIYSPLNGSSAFGNNEDGGFFASVPIQGWTSDARFLAAIPVQQTCYIKDVKSSNTNGGTFTSGSWYQRDLNTLEGDCSQMGITVSSNVFTLPKGKYEFSAKMPAFRVEQHKSKLVKDPSGTPVDLILGTSEISTSTANTTNYSYIDGQVEITTSTPFEIQHRCSNTVTTNGLGYAVNYSVDEVYTIVKITKVK